MSWSDGILMDRASVFEEIILNPNIDPKEAKMSCREGRDIWRWVRGNKISSAKSNKVYDRCCSGTPWMSGWDLMAKARGSKLRIKSKGDRGQPCLVPLLRGKVCDRWEDSCTWEEGFEYRAFKAWMNGPMERTANKNGQLEQSKAFCASRLKTMAGRFVLVRRSIKSIVHLVLSPACLVGTKPTWSLCINDDNKGESLLARIFVNIL